MTWKPKTTIEILQAKAELFKTIRNFFESKNILEVQTPLLCEYSVTDPYIESIETSYGFLQTSPEYAMKKLLALYKQSIFQICKAFRDEGSGSWHMQEFTMLEWYSVDATMFDLIKQVCELISIIFTEMPIEKISYRDLFLRYIDLDPFQCSAQQAYLYLKKSNKLPIGIDDDQDLTDYLQMIMSEVIEPHINKNNALIVYDYPQGQAALAKLAQRDYGMAAERFELYIKGVECGNGFHELQNADEQHKRFQENMIKREQLGLKHMDIDSGFMQALGHGLPNCSGIAMGLDRILMLKESINHIDQVNF
jgi:lysyl-tRNA synthetase class 2